MANYVVLANAGVAVITVDRDNSSGDTVMVSYAASGGTAVSGVDFGIVSGVLTFGPGDTFQNFTVPINPMSHG